jgi:cytochrome c-type biogenesis protein CcmH
MRSGRAATLTLGAAGFVAAAALAIALVGNAGPRTLSERVDEVAESLRCPVCQNLSVADSTSGVAGEMRRSIAAQLRAGRSPDQIRTRFVAAYGEWILLSPPARGAGLVAWAIPVIVVLGGVTVGGLALRRWTVRGPPS